MKRLAALALLPLLGAACGGGSAVRATTAHVLAAGTTRCEPGYRSDGSATLAHAAVARGPLTAYRAPGGAVLARFGAVNANDYPTVFTVRGRVVGRDCAARWYRVQLPLRPNGVEGWVRAGAVALQPVRTRIEVDLSRRRVTVFHAGRRVLSTPAAIGSPATPTPIGRFYVNQRLVPTDPAGAFGPDAIGVSAFSPVLTGWAQGGPIAIHGTNEPWSIGKAVSNGCVRVPNGVVARIFRLALAGTPVTIHP